ncbi:MAG TPA: hypothetical protein VG321_00345 [Solirubrobacteraceae bacterium]|nr:hypothetical protein [Solirubrobacteraceae bacterium]
MGTIKGRLKICGGPAAGRLPDEDRRRRLREVGLPPCHPRGHQPPGGEPVGGASPGRFTARVEPGRYRLALLAPVVVGRAG